MHRCWACVNNLKKRKKCAFSTRTRYALFITRLATQILERECCSVASRASTECVPGCALVNPAQFLFFLCFAFFPALAKPTVAKLLEISSSWAADWRMWKYGLWCSVSLKPIPMAVLHADCRQRSSSQCILDAALYRIALQWAKVILSSSLFMCSFALKTSGHESCAAWHVMQWAECLAGAGHHGKEPEGLAWSSEMEQ